MRAFTVARRLIKQIAADKRSIGLMFFAPIFVILLLNVILTSATTKPTIAIVSAPLPVVQALETHLNVYSVVDEEKAIMDLKSQKANAYIVFTDQTFVVTVEGSDPKVSTMIMNLVSKALVGQGAGQGVMPIQPEIIYFYGSKNLSNFDAIAPLFMGFFIFFFVFLIAGVAFLRERISGTLERVLATPLRRHEIVLGYFIGFGVFVAMQTIIIQLFIIYGIGVETQGSFWLILLVNLILAGQSLALGTLLSTFAKNEFQLFQFIPIVIVPQILFCGFFDVREAPAWVDVLSRIFPLTYGASALRDIMVRGLGFSEVRNDILILVAYALVFLILNTLALKKYRKA